MTHIELTRFRVLKGKSKKVDEWLRFLNDHLDEGVLTLDREKMYVETIFREQIDGVDYLYWFSIQGLGGADVEDSDSWIDKKHLEYWDECIDESYHPVDLSTEVVLIPRRIRQAMKDEAPQHSPES